jgi:hypothetical protein
MVLLVATFLVVNEWLPKDKALSRGDLGHDFLAFYSAGTFAREGNFAGMYDMHAVAEFEFGIARQIHLKLAPGFMPWWNPPFAAIPMEPLSMLPYHQAQVVWLGINLFCCAIAMVLLVRVLKASGATDWRIWGLAPALTAVSMPFIMSLTHGQNTGVSLLLLTIVVVLWRARRAFAAGAVCGLLFYKPQLGALVAVAMLLRLGWRSMVGVACTGLVLLIATLVALPGALSAFIYKMPVNLVQFQEGSQYYWERHVTFKALWRLMIQGHEKGATATSVVVLWSACVAVLAVGLLLVLCRDRVKSSDREPIAATVEDRAIAATILCSPLLMPFYFDYDLLLLAIPAVLFAAERIRLHQISNSWDRWTTLAWVLMAAYMLVHPHVADATNIHGNAILLACGATVTVLRSLMSHKAATTQSASEPVEPLARLAA